MRIAAILTSSLLLAACATTPAASPTPPPARPPAQQQAVPPSAPAPPPVAGFRMPQILQGAGLQGVIQEGAASLMRQFGAPRLDVAEGDMRKLQFAGDACVLDIFLYPLRPGAEPVATHVETRRASDGAEVDRLDCMTALRRRG